MGISEAVLEACHFRLNESRERIQICIGKLTEDQLIHRYNDVSNSIANIVIHLQGNITQYMLSALGGLPDKRVRDDEFIPAGGINKVDLALEIDKVFLDALNIIKEMDANKCVQVLTIQGFEMTGIGAVIHVVEHASYHVGQITYLTKMYTSQETNYYAGIDLNIHNE